MPITQKTLLSVLSNYYSGDILKAGEVSKFILDNREEKVVEKINRKIFKTATEESDEK